MIPRPPISTSPDALFPYTSLFRSDQLRKHLYGLANAPVIVGKCDEKGQWLFPSNGELGSGLIAARLGTRILARGGDAELSARVARSEEHTSEPQSLMRISYGVFCLQKKNTRNVQQYHHDSTY